MVISAVRRVANFVVAAVCVPGVIVAAMIAERMRRGAGRGVIVRGCRRVAAVCGITIDIVGRERVPDGPAVVVANHGSILDIPVLLQAVPTARFAAAVELFRVPLLRSALAMLDCVRVPRTEPRQALRLLEGALSGGDAGPLVVFPEGGLAPRGGRLPFRSGAFSIAIRAAVPVVPIRIHGTSDLLPRGGRFGVAPGPVRIEVRQPIPTHGLGPSDRKRLRDVAEAAVFPDADPMEGAA